MRSGGGKKVRAVKKTVNRAYIVLVGLVLFMGALCIAQGARTKEEPSAGKQVSAQTSAEPREAPGGAQTTL